jgi:carboxyl-terminal processing protease
MFTRRFLIPIGLFFTVVGIIVGLRINDVASQETLREQLVKLDDVLSLTKKYYVEDVDTQKLIEAAINGVLGTLDPHSVYIPASAMPRVQEEFRGSFEGIGIEFDVINDTLIVVAPIVGGPSEALGILAGDKIVRIDGESCVGITREQVPKKLRGPKGTHVKVSVSRSGVKGFLEFDITRDTIPLYSVIAASKVNDRIGYIKVTGFAQTTHDELVRALRKLKEEGMKGLILDLRNNPGGYLEQAVMVADEFLPAGKKIVYTKGRRPEYNEEYLSTQAGEFENLPLIVLIDGGSASASEIVSGAIQDWDRGLIVGLTSFGKGLVQKQFDLKDGSAFRLTTARYYTPSGRLIQRPYDNKGTYREEVFERDEKEGENIEHQAEGKDTTRPMFHTPSGRRVFGGGGITPDYIVKLDTVTSFVASLSRRNLFREYSIKYLDENGPRLRNDYGKDFEKFNSRFEITEKIIADFKAFVKAKGVDIKEQEFQRDLSYIKLALKATIARPLYNWDGYFQVLSPVDNQFQKALTLFPEAQRIAGLKF